MACLSISGISVKNTNQAAAAEDVMCKMFELLSAPFSLNTGIRSRFEFNGRRERGGSSSHRSSEGDDEGTGLCVDPRDGILSH